MIDQTISHYKILEKLGEGGMGVVYKAQDTTLDRLVALKFLPPHVSSSTEDKARFIQEAKAAAALSHPNICTIYGVEEYDGQTFIAMEFVDGKTLKDSGTNTQLKRAVDIGIQLADGLAAAHEKGVVHRDIKPENIMIRKDGRVQIMDFGLAKLKGASRLTKEGSTVGTAGYMSPEQIQGQETDHRSDIFSLGVVLYELIAGQSPFKGAHEAAVSYEIVNVDPEPMSAVKPEIDPDLDRIVLECLQKEPDERYQAVKDISKELKRFKRESSRSHLSRVTAVRAASELRGSVTPERIMVARSQQLIDRVRSANFLWITLALLFFTTSLVSLFVFRGSPSTPDVVRAFIPPPEKHSFSELQGGGHLAVSPDGHRTAFVASDSAGRTNLWVRAVNALTATMLTGTEGALCPFWSPDSRYIGFFAGGKLKKVEASGGPVFAICDAVDARGASWSQQGLIVFPPTQLSGLFVVSDGGGAPKQITTLDSARNEQTHRWPWMLPDGKHFLYLARTTASGSGSAQDAFCVATLDGKFNKRLIQGASNIAYASGHILYMRENTLMAHAFDADALELKGDPFPIAESVEFSSRYSVSTFSVSQTGVLVYQGHSAIATPELALVDPKGKRLFSLGHPEIYANARLSRDNQRIAMDLYEVLARNADIWILEIARGVRTRFTFDPAVDTSPIWSPDGKTIIFSSNRKRALDLYEKVSSGASNEQILVESDRNKTASNWSQDGKFILFTSTGDPKTKADIWVLPLEGDRKPRPFLQTDYDEGNARFSPDMKWVTYQSDESGRPEVYVRPFPGAGARWQVSTSGGTQPRWLNNGKEIVYLGSGKIMAAEVNGSGSTFVVGKVWEYFDPGPIGATTIRDISGDGQKILVDISRSRQAAVPLTLVVNWTEELKKK